MKIKPRIFFYLCWLIGLLPSNSHAEQNKPLPKSAVEYVYVVDLDHLKGVDTVLYSFGTIYVPEDVIRSRPSFRADESKKQAVNNVFQEISNISVFKATDFSYPETLKDNILNILFYETWVEVNNPSGTGTLFLVSVSAQLTKGENRTVIGRQSPSVSFIVKDSIDEYIIGYTNAVRSLIGHLPNYIVCANEGTKSKNCLEPNYKLYEVQDKK